MSCSIPSTHILPFSLSWRDGGERRKEKRGGRGYMMDVSTKQKRKTRAARARWLLRKGGTGLVFVLWDVWWWRVPLPSHCPLKQQQQHMATGMQHAVLAGMPAGMQAAAATMPHSTTTTYLLPMPAYPTPPFCAVPSHLPTFLALAASSPSPSSHLPLLRPFPSFLDSLCSFSIILFFLSSCLL